MHPAITLPPSTQMVQDYRRIDFATVQQQVSWVCDGCDPDVVARYVAAPPLLYLSAVYSLMCAEQGHVSCILLRQYLPYR